MQTRVVASGLGRLNGICPQMRQVPGQKWGDDGGTERLPEPGVGWPGGPGRVPLPRDTPHFCRCCFEGSTFPPSADVLQYFIGATPGNVKWTLARMPPPGPTRPVTVSVWERGLFFVFSRVRFSERGETARRLLS